MKNSTFIESGLRSSDVCMPCEEITFQWAGGDSKGGYFFLFNFLIVFHKSFVREGL